MNTPLTYLTVIGVLAFYLASCAGEPSRRQAIDAPAYATTDPYGNSIPGRHYGPQDRAGNQTQNGLPPGSGCQYTTRC
jgi:hypothetical protein